MTSTVHSLFARHRPAAHAVRGNRASASWTIGSFFSGRPNRSGDFDGDLARHRLTGYVCSREVHPP